MKINIYQQLEGAKKARGLAVIIDVFRACTVEACLTASGADKIIAVGEIETALSFKQKIPGCVLIGERRGVKLPNFDFGNSPSQLEGFDFRGKTAVHTTSAGTQGIVNASGADEIITGSFVNAKAIAEYIRRKSPNEVSLVCMGLDAVEPTDEDTLCAEYIKSIIEGNPLPDIAERADALRYTSGAKFFKPELSEIFPQRDFEICVKPDIYDFVIKAEKSDDDGFIMKRINVLQ